MAGWSTRLSSGSDRPAQPVDGPADVDLLNASVAPLHVRVPGLPLSPSAMLLALVPIDDLDASSQQRTTVVIGGTLMLMICARPYEVQSCGTATWPALPSGLDLVSPGCHRVAISNREAFHMRQFAARFGAAFMCLAARDWWS